jgi:hypothetical protein
LPKNIFLNDENKYKPWAKIICDLLKQSKIKDVLDIINNISIKQGQKSTFDLSKYILNNINNINYAKYINKGYFIGSGAVESANRYVLQERLKLPGMRWETTNGQAVLSLMAKLKSGLWEKDVVKASYRHFGVRPPHSFRLLGGENLTQGDQISRIGNR